MAASSASHPAAAPPKRHSYYYYCCVLLPSLLLIANGLSIAIGWTKLIMTTPQFELSFRCRDPDSQWLMWPHWLAEYTTSMCAVLSGCRLLLPTDDSTTHHHGRDLGLFAAGAMFYTSLNSLSWALADSERMVFAYFMIGGLVSSVVSLFSLLSLQSARPSASKTSSSLARDEQKKD